MVQLKQVSVRLKSIKNIQKITKTMKMVSASKFTKAEKELQAARPFGYGPRKFYESTRLVKGSVDAKVDDKKKGPPPDPIIEKPPEKEGAKIKRIFVAVTSDRGLCGGVHSGVARRVRREVAAQGVNPEVNKVVCIGEKSRGMLRRTYPLNILISVKDVGRIAPVFLDAALMSAAITESGYQYDWGEIYFNKYYTPVKYELSLIPFFNKELIEMAPNMHAFDEVDLDQLESYVEFTLAALIYYALKENAASELSARMSAMDNATKNAEDMIRHLRLLFNRTRQAVITRELIEIISGAAALNK